MTVNPIAKFGFGVSVSFLRSLACGTQNPYLCTGLLGVNTTSSVNRVFGYLGLLGGTHLPRLLQDYFESTTL